MKYYNYITLFFILMLTISTVSANTEEAQNNVVTPALQEQILARTN